MMRRLESGKSFPLLGRGIHVRSTGAFGYLILRSLAALKKIRRYSLRFKDEQGHIESWVDATVAALKRDIAFAGALAELPRLLKGYGDTHARGRRNYANIMTTIVMPALASRQEAQTAPLLRRAISAALADPDSAALSVLIAGASPSRTDMSISGATDARQPA
jgi:indolepyruvate ferredoxin oxidoreductase beta subunit